MHTGNPQALSHLRICNRRMRQKKNRTQDFWHFSCYSLQFLDFYILKMLIELLLIANFTLCQKSLFNCALRLQSGDSRKKCMHDDSWSKWWDLILDVPTWTAVWRCSRIKQKWILRVFVIYCSTIISLERAPDANKKTRFIQYKRK